MFRHIAVILAIFTAQPVLARTEQEINVSVESMLRQARVGRIMPEAYRACAIGATRNALQSGREEHVNWMNNPNNRADALTNPLTMIPVDNREIGRFCTAVVRDQAPQEQNKPFESLLPDHVLGRLRRTGQLDPFIASLRQHIYNITMQNVDSFQFLDPDAPRDPATPNQLGPARDPFTNQPIPPRPISPALALVSGYLTGRDNPDLARRQAGSIPPASVQIIADICFNNIYPANPPQTPGGPVVRAVRTCTLGGMALSLQDAPRAQR